MQIPVDTRGTRIDAQRNREAVIDAALELLARNPTASMKTVAERSGVGRTTVYRHFPTRIDLVHALFERVVEESKTATSEVIDQDAPAADVLRALGPALIGVGQRFQYLHELRQMGNEVIAESTFDPDDPVRLYVMAAMERGEIRGDLPLQWILTMISATASATLIEFHAGRMDAERAGEILGETFVRTFATNRA
ncbi:MAG: TetR/AcrR family transcriptional regulator [Solirubrobacterales bacterium]